MTHADIIDLLITLDAKLSREDSKLLTGKVNKAVHVLRAEQFKLERAALDALTYEDSCNGVSGLYNFN